MIGIVRQLWLNKWKVKSPNVTFGILSRVGDGSCFEGNNHIGKFSFVSTKMGKYSYVGDNVVLIDSCIGRYTSISSNVRLINGKHPFKPPYVSTSPIFYAKHTPLGCSLINEQLFKEFAYVDECNRIQVIIGNDCWIGFGASIIAGVCIGDGAVVLANATVTKDVPPFAIVGGVPAKVVGKRYDDTTIEKLLDIKWWDKDEAWIKENIELFSNIEDFKNI